ncbi:MAG TPA: hypothetical protein PKG90_11580 [Chitinophagaceae bacterium]|nr:hypothetical protein [Chitinophagaceae bacterium]HNU13134.1 hypothetical protein [Chitinophagaceae bacterium]
MKKLILFITILFNLALNAQNSPSWIKNLKIRQSFEDDDSKQNPAAFTMTFPKGKESSYLIDMGVLYKLNSKSNTKIGSLIAEYHRINLTDEEVNNFQIGYKHEWFFKKPVVSVKPEDLGNPDYFDAWKTFKLNSAIKYRWDDIDGSHGIAGSFLFSYFQQGSKYKTWWSSWNINENKTFAWIVTPQFGVEFQHNFKADSTKIAGFVGRGVGKFSLSFGAMKPDPDDKIIPLNKWLFTADMSGKYDLFGKEYTDNRFHPLIKTGLDIFLIYKPVKLIIGGSFTYGDNPVEGFKEFKFKPQQFWVVAIKIQK